MASPQSNHQLIPKHEFAHSSSTDDDDQLEIIQWDFGMQQTDSISFPSLDMFPYTADDGLTLYASLDILPTLHTPPTHLMQGDNFFSNYGNAYDKLDDEIMGDFHDFPFNIDQPPLLLLSDISDTNNAAHGGMKNNGHGHGHHNEEAKKKKINSRSRVAKGQSSTKMLTKEEISKYFYMPIAQATKELNIGLTPLKKRCRELGIPRWPHRKLMSIQTLIQNVKELEKKEEGEEKSRQVVGMLEHEKKLMEESPDLKLMDKTKRLRQACFKAKYKRRKIMTDTESATPPMIMDGSGHFDQFSLSSANPVAISDQKAIVARDDIEEDVKSWIIVS